MTAMAPAIDLDGLLRRLHLPTVRRLYPELEQRAEADGLSYRDFLAMLIAEEVAHRAQTRIERCVRRAHFPFLQTIEDFDFTFQSRVRLPCSAATSAPSSSRRATASSSAAPAAPARRTWRSPSPTAPSRTASRRASPRRPR